MQSAQAVMHLKSARQTVQRANKRSSVLQEDVIASEQVCLKCGLSGWLCLVALRAARRRARRSAWAWHFVRITASLLRKYTYDMAAEQRMTSPARWAQQIRYAQPTVCFAAVRAAAVS